jgi:hypothetical protein
MARIPVTVPAPWFDALFANCQRALVLAAGPELMPGNLVELTDGKRRCERLITHVAGDCGSVLQGAALVSLRPLTKAEKGPEAPHA